MTAARKYMDHGGNGVAIGWTFLFIWVVCNVLTAIIFLNFIVAEACVSYTRVTETLESVVQKGKASLVSEAEEMVEKSKLNST